MLVLIQQLTFQTIVHPECNPMKQGLGYHLFEPLKVALRRRRLSNDDEIKEAVDTWLVTVWETIYMVILLREGVEER